MACVEDVDISPLPQLRKERKSVVGEQLFGDTVSGERVCVLDNVCGSGGRVKFWGAKKTKTKENLP